MDMTPLFWIGYLLILSSVLARCYYQTYLARRLQLAGLAVYFLMFVTWVLL